MSRPGRPKKNVAVTPEQFITSLAECGCSKTEIAARLDISVDTLDRNYAELCRKGREAGKSKLREKLIQTALAGNVTALIFLGKSMLGLKETAGLELSGPDGKPVELNTSDARQRLADLVTRTASRDSEAVVPRDADRVRG